MTLLFLALGLFAGVLTTVAGQGGGMLLLLACTAIGGPHAALAITAPALLLGNLHRALLLRKHIDRPIAWRMIVGTVPGALAGGLLAGVTPAWALRALLVAIALGGIAKAVGLLRFSVPRRALVPAGILVGMMTGTAGGAGVLFAPVLLSLGLTGRAFVATSSAIALSTHIGRVAGYAGLGLFSRSLVVPTIAVALAIFVGNAVASAALEKFQGVLTRSRTTALEYTTLVVCVALSVAGLG